MRDDVWELTNVKSIVLPLAVRDDVLSVPSPLEEQREPTRYELCDPVSET